MPTDREWLLRRLEMEARAFVNADRSTRDLRMGRVLGFLEVGVASGYWSKRSAERVANSIGQRWRVGRIRRFLR